MDLTFVQLIKKSKETPPAEQQIHEQAKRNANKGNKNKLGTSKPQQKKEKE